MSCLQASLCREVITLLKIHESKIPMLSGEEEASVSLLKEKLKESYTVSNLVLYGSKARADWDVDSDVNLLVIIEEEVTEDLKDKLHDIQFEVSMKYPESLLSCYLVNRKQWKDPSVFILIRDSVLKEGVEIEL